MLVNALVPKRPASEERLRALKRQQIIDGLWYAGIAITIAGVSWLGYRYWQGTKRSNTVSAPSITDRSANVRSGHLVRRASRAVQGGLS